MPGPGAVPDRRCYWTPARFCLASAPELVVRTCCGRRLRRVRRRSGRRTATLPAASRRRMVRNAPARARPAGSCDESPTAGPARRTQAALADAGVRIAPADHVRSAHRGRPSRRPRPTADGAGGPTRLEGTPTPSATAGRVADVPPRARAHRRDLAVPDTAPAAGRACTTGGSSRDAGPPHPRSRTSHGREQTPRLAAPSPSPAPASVLALPRHASDSRLGQPATTCAAEQGYCRAAA